eukprot:14278511-Ditylum_brightwellii.AAC.1
MFKFQIHFVVRLDDTCHVKKKNITPCFQFLFALLCCLCWSENVREERDAPEQIMLGAMDYRYCILLALTGSHESEQLML